MFSAKTVPLPQNPPNAAVPYKVSPDKINPVTGTAPSLFVASMLAAKLYKLLKSEPLVIILNTVPFPGPCVGTPPDGVVPYNVVPDRSNPPNGWVPSPVDLKLCRFVLR